MNKSLLRKLDNLGADNGYSSRSEGVREAIREYIIYDEWMSKLKGNVTCIVHIIYDHEEHEDLDNLIDLYYIDRTVPRICLQYDENNDIGFMTLTDDAGNVRNLVQKIMVTHGVKSVRLSEINFSE